MTAGLKIEVRGTVQGVGFRPWVHRLARELGIGGRVFNHARGVTIEAFGQPRDLELLTSRLRGPPPGNVRVRDLRTTAIRGEPARRFEITESEEAGARALSIPPDLATCPACLAEIADPADRHYGYPFTSCTACGPRFTVATDVPYDRPATTMAPFEQCPECLREYEDIGDRRFHAQTNACPRCGPRLALTDLAGGALAPPESALAKAVEMLRDGAILGVKGLGGFHLACDAQRGDVVATLRRRKHRDEKPFAVMVASLRAAREIAVLSDAEAELLASAERPIVLAVARQPRRLCRELAPDGDWVGLMLPYTPLHHLLLAAVEHPLVMTSANPAGEPICQHDDEACRRLANIADALLTNDREIASRCDDSVARVIAGQPTLMRRSRAYVPRPIALAKGVARPVLGCGAHLKNSFCLAAGDSAYFGPHVGDLEGVATLDFYARAIERLESLVQIRPDILAHDLHPGYASTRYALEREGVTTVGVQHHHAHVASAMAEHALPGPVLGVAFDGTGWGTDGTAWGGELLFARFAGFTRMATLRPLPLIGGERAIEEPWRIALAALSDAFDGEPPLDELSLFRNVAPGAQRVARQMLSGNLNCPRARGVGRVFDAVAALLLARPRASYDGQLAMALDQLARGRALAPYGWVLHPGRPAEVDLRPMYREIVADLVAGVPAATIAVRFHDTMIAATVGMVESAVREVGRVPVVLTGGVFQNARLAEGVHRTLAPRFDLRLHGEVPGNDGGIALGQVMVADAIARGGG